MYELSGESFRPRAPSSFSRRKPTPAGRNPARTLNGLSGIRRALAASRPRREVWCNDAATFDDAVRVQSRRRLALPWSPPRTLALSARLTTPWSDPSPAAKGSISNAPRTAARASAFLREGESRKVRRCSTASDPSRTESAKGARHGAGRLTLHNIIFSRGATAPPAKGTHSRMVYVADGLSTTNTPMLNNEY